MNRRDRRLTIDYVLGKDSARRNPFDTFDSILETERNYNARSTFFALPTPSRANVEIVRRIHKSGWDVGLHGIRDSFALASSLAEQKDVLEQALQGKVRGNRYHSLNLMIPRTFEFERLCGFEYDSSYFPPRYGQKRLLKPFHAIKGLLEIPLAFMDSDFSEIALPKFGGLEKAWERIQAVLEQYRVHEGVCTVLWHPHAFYDERNAYHRKHYQHVSGFASLYERILEYASQNGARLCGCDEIAKEWNATSDGYW